MVRCYVAATLATVRRWRDADAVPAGTPATAVTPAVRAELPDSDDEERENAAALAAVDLAVAAGADPVTLVVVAFDAAEVAVPPAADDGARVRLDAPVPTRRWAAVFAVSPAADGPELAWYAVEEIDTIG